MKIFLLFVVTSVVVVGLLFGGLYYRYVTNTDSPYDEIGITLNTMMPAPINAWGCSKLKENFSGALPPHGCSVEGDPKTWRE